MKPTVQTSTSTRKITQRTAHLDSLPPISADRADQGRNRSPLAQILSLVLRDGRAEHRGRDPTGRLAGKTEEATTVSGPEELTAERGRRAQPHRAVRKKKRGRETGSEEPEVALTEWRDHLDTGARGRRRGGCRRGGSFLRPGEQAGRRGVNLAHRHRPLHFSRSLLRLLRSLAFRVLNCGCSAPGGVAAL